MDLQLTGKRALVTGGRSGIGRAIARQLALEGVRVAIAARDLAATERAAAELSAETGGEIYGFSADTGDDGSVKALIAAVAVRLGGIDILVNAAAKPGGGGPPPKLAEVTDDLFWSDVNVKVMGYLRVAREAAPLMAAAGWGRIINISGLAARQTGSIIGSVRNVAVSAGRASPRRSSGCRHSVMWLPPPTSSMPSTAPLRNPASISMSGSR